MIERIQVSGFGEFVRKHGQCVVGIDEAGYNWIEVYDDYRE